MSCAVNTGPDDRSLGVYIHFPWCIHKCPYCDFNSHPLRGSLQESAYLSALQQDLSAQLADLEQDAERTDKKISSVFFGGGTPSLFNPDTFTSMLRQLDPWLTTDAEITMEANPGTLEHKPLEGYRDAGINRLSLGAQSFDPSKLAVLGRIHGADDIERSFTQARSAGFDNINLDLMYALPEQSSTGALEDLSRAIALSPEHLSWYQLTLEPKTEFYARPPALPGEDIVSEMEERGWLLLADAGFQRYEISAYARPGRMARHNLNYWRFGNYLGVGAGAHGKFSRRGRIFRTTKPGQPRLYMAEPDRHSVQPVPVEAVAGEFLLNALRLVDGVSFSTFTARTGFSIDHLQPRWQRYVELGLLRSDRLAATAAGYRFLDSLLLEFINN